MPLWFWGTKITPISCCRHVFMTCKGDKDMNQLQQHLQIPHAKRHPVLHTGKSTANAVSMTTQPGDNRFYFFPSVQNPNPLPQEKKNIWIFLLLFEDSLEKNEMRMSFEQCFLCQLYREKTSYHMSKADAICNFQTGLLVCCETISQMNYGSGTHIRDTYRINLSSFLKGNLVRYPSLISWILTLHLNQAK